uniref:Transmembrane protein n=1 Tax=Steinernema glaseri TaxID=37863 RepID=A0A1I8A6E9_9BILA
MENIRAIRLLFPINLVHFLCFAATMIAQPLNNALSFNLSPRDYSVRIETLNFIPVYSVLIPVVLWYVCRTYSVHSRGPTFRACSVSDVLLARQKHDTEIYFKQFEKAINEPQKRDSFISQCRVS